MNHRPDGSPIADGDDVLVTVGPQAQDWPAIEDAPELTSFAPAVAARVHNDHACDECGKPSGYGRLCAACYIRFGY